VHLIYIFVSVTYWQHCNFHLIDDALAHQPCQTSNCEPRFVVACVVHHDQYLRWHCVTGVLAICKQRKPDAFQIQIGVASQMGINNKEIAPIGIPMDDNANYVHC
jgi:hypothetical protein